jgi:hypothetical protein
LSRAASVFYTRPAQPDAPARLAAAPTTEFRAKLRVNRALRALVAVPIGVKCAAVGSALVPSVLARLIAYAGDVGLTSLRPPASAAAAT